MKNKEKASKSILGIFEGECADADVTNKNGLDITREVWEKTFASDEYKEGIERGHLLGFLGHPKDVSTENWQDACIVMTDGWIDDDGKVYGKFNLIDTPVGRIVKAFIDGGVTFGISVRGVGDIINNSVDPDTFIFRGFDLVTFPAYPNSIPEFKEIAAATDAESQKKYQRICAAVEAELPDIQSREAISVIKDQFPMQSDTYANIENREAELLEIDDVDTEARIQLLEEQVNGLTELYTEEVKKNQQLENELTVQTELFESTSIKASKESHILKRVYAAQRRDIDELNAQKQKEVNNLKRWNKTYVSANKKLKKSLSESKSQLEDANKSIENYNAQLIKASQELKEIQHDYELLQSTNLQYRTKIEASEQLISQKDLTIQDLEGQIDKTVIEASQQAARLSDLDEHVKELEQAIEESQQLISEYQDSYASLYSKALGVDLSRVSVLASATTSVDELQNRINGSSSQYSISDVFVEPQAVDIEDDEDNLVTL